MVSAEREAITGVWGPVPETLVRESGVKPPAAEHLFALSQPEELANLS